MILQFQAQPLSNFFRNYVGSIVPLINVYKSSKSCLNAFCFSGSAFSIAYVGLYSFSLTMKGSERSCLLYLKP